MGKYRIAIILNLLYDDAERILEKFDI